MASLPGKPGLAGTRKVKPIWMITYQEIMGWQWYQLDYMQIICTSLQTHNHASTSSLRCSSWCPTNSVKSLKAIYFYSKQLKII